MSVPEKRKRLIPESSDSELDDYYISPRAKPSKEDAPIDKNQARSALVKENEEETRIEKLNFSILKSESDHGFGASGENRGTKDKLMGTEWVKKRKGEFNNGKIDAMGTKTESAKDSKGPKLGVPQCRYEKEEVRAGSFVSEKKKDLKQNGKMPILKKGRIFMNKSIKRRVVFDPIKAGPLKLNGSSSACNVKLESKGDLNGYKREDLNKLKCFNSECVEPTAFPSGNLCMNGKGSVIDGSSVEVPEYPSSIERTRSNEINSRRGDVSTSGSSIPANKRIGRLNKGRNDVKKKVKDQIRNMLFDAGWSIELRPRRNRDYEDSVYVSPQGTSYWSITKAYAAFQEDQKTNNNSIAKDKLEMLKRNVRNKRGHKTGTMEASREAKWSMRKRLHGDERLDNYAPYEWRRTVLSWLIDQGVVSENSKVKYMNVRRNKTRLKGRIRRDGIYCSCCSKILSVHKFELHAGSKEKQAYENIYVEELSVSLTQCLLDAWKKQGEGDRKGFHEVEACGDDASDDTCGICGDGGDLICCDGCPSTFHLACLGIQVLPLGDWRCKNCSCKFCKSTSYSENQETHKSCSVLLACRQCGQKYHEGCIPEKDAICTKSGSGQGVNNSFCGLSCRKLYKQLQRLLGARNEIEGGYSWTLVRRLDESSPRYLQRLSQVANCNSKIAVAFNVMDECFLPITDQRTGIDLIHNVIYNCGSNFSRLDFGGFYTFILERGDEIISAASVRIHGRNLAEMPIIGTRNMYRRRGMCRRLLNGIESALCSLNVKKLIIPAISELKSTWTNVFGFTHLDHTQRKEISSLNLLVFPDTGLLQKILLAKPSDGVHASTVEGPSEGNGKDNDVKNVTSLFQKPSEVDVTLLRESKQDAYGEQNMLEATTEMPKDAEQTTEKLPLAKVVASGC